jgi:glycosyltransferase involved in cell wall biosynthesis
MTPIGTNTSREATGSPLVTVITPAYNRADFIGGVIESVLSQDYPKVEYIVLDDGSTDGTWDVVQRYADRIVAVAHDNMGETRTVNAGLQLARGEIVGVVNSDDPILPGLIRAAVDAMEADKSVAVAYPDWNMIDAAGNVIEHIRTDDYSYVDMIRRHHCVPGPGAFFRKDVAQRLGGRDPQFRYVADFDFWLRAGLVGPFKRIPQTLATFRWHAGGASSSEAGLVMAEEHIRLVRKVYSLPELTVEAAKVRREAFSSAHYIAAVVSGPPSVQRETYFLKALLYSPTKYLFEYRDRLRQIVQEFLSVAVRVPGYLFRKAKRAATRWLR